jgi:hypothetical protein
MIRSLLAIIAGIAVLTATSFAIESVANPLLMRLFPEAIPNEAAINRNEAAAIFMLFYSGLCVAAGGYVCGWIARRAPIAHAAALGVVQVGMTVAAMSAFQAKAPMATWIATLTLTIPFAVAGGVLRKRAT